MDITGKGSLASYLSVILTVVLIILAGFILIGIGLEIFSIFVDDTVAIVNRVSLNFSGLRFNMLAGPGAEVNISDSFRILTLGYLLIVLFIVFNLRKIFKNLKNEKLFDYQNPKFMNRIGVSVILLGVVSSFLRFSSGWMLYDYLVSAGLDVDVVFQFDITTIFIGIVIILFASIFKKSVDIAEEQKFTV